MSEEQLDTLVERIKDKGREKRDVLTKEEFDAILKGVLA